MANSLNDYQSKAADWRKLLRSNERRTFIVIFIFILIYVSLGLLVDLYFYSELYVKVPLSTLFYELITLQLIPYATCITTGVSIISLWITYAWYDKLMLLGTEYHEITPENAKTLEEQQLYNTVEEMKIAAALRFMPRVFIIEADYMNAFASGYSEKSAMVAITRGLLEKLNRSEVSAVMAHEISHIRHMDIRLTLMASVLTNLMLMVIDLLFYNVYFSSRKSGREGGNILVFVILLLRYLLPILTVILMLFLSRTREYMADAGSVELMRDNEPLARALLKIQGDYVDHQDKYSKEYQATPHESVRRESYIFEPSAVGISGIKTALSDVFSTHPDIQKRLEAIGFKEKG